MLYEDYFDLDIVRCGPDEVMVDLGAYTGDTVLSYLRNYGDDCYRRIYCYEITPANYEKLRTKLAPYRDIDCRLKGVSDAEGRMKLLGNAADSANRLSDEAGARQHILNDHPKLLISVYHSNEDLWRIPRYIKEISRDYSLYLRHHGSPIYPTEITLIAV